MQRPAHLLLTPTPHPTRAIGSGLIPNRGKGSASLKNSQNLHFCARELANLHTPWTAFIFNISFFAMFLCKHYGPHWKCLPATSQVHWTDWHAQKSPPCLLQTHSLNSSPSQHTLKHPHWPTPGSGCSPRLMAQLLDSHRWQVLPGRFSSHWRYEVQLPRSNMGAERWRCHIAVFTGSRTSFILFPKCKYHL